MRIHLFLTLTLIAATLLPPAGASAAVPDGASSLSSKAAATYPEPDSGSTLCPPGSYPSAPDDCLPLGPSQSIASLAQTGIPWPIVPLPAYTPDPSLGDVPYNYFKVQEAGAYVFPSIGAAETEDTSGLMIGPGRILYVSYIDRIDNGTGVYYMLQDGGWIRGEGARAALPYPFQGLLFSSTPANAFGWVMGKIQSRVAPGNASPFTDHVYYRFNVVQVYAAQAAADGTTWLLIGPEEWVEARYVSRVEPRASSPEGIATPRWIEINLYEQTLAVYDNNQLVFATMVSTGVEPYWTQPGIFSIYEKTPVETMSGTFEADRSDYYYLESVPWTMYFDGKRAMHGAYWHSNFGYQMSHGCVNMSLGDSHWLYDWAHNGDVVYVYDPSGRTPTDASLYGTGAP